MAAWACSAPDPAAVGQDAGSAAGRAVAADEPWSIDRAQVLYTGRRDGKADLYLYDRGTGGTRRLTSHGDDGSTANAGRLSPEGDRLAYQVIRGGNYDLYLLELTEGEAVNLTDHPEFDVNPVWSPSGDRLAFMSTRGFELGSIGPFPGHLYVVDLAGGAIEPLTREPLTSSLGPSDWSADGKTLLLARVHGERPDLLALDIATGEETQLTETEEGEYSAVYSNDGARIAFHAETASESQIVVMDLATGERRSLTSGPGLRYGPRWSPDDSWLLFTSSDDGEQYDIEAVRVADGEIIEVVATEEDEREGSFLRRTVSSGS